MPLDGTTLPGGQASTPDNGHTITLDEHGRPVPSHPLLGFTVAEAAALLRVARTTIYDWLKGPEPQLASRKIGKSHYIRRESLYALLDDLTPTGVGS